MKRKRIYISLPISGVEAQSEIKAAQLQKHFEAQGYEVVNPWEIGRHLEEIHALCGLPKPVWAEYMQWDLIALEHCDEVYFCKGWENSLGCIEEKNLSNKLKIKMSYENN
jgi:hypothetical protein